MMAISESLRRENTDFIHLGKSRKWLLRKSQYSVRDKILLQAAEWRWLAHLEDFVRTGRPLDFHSTMSELELDLYHRSMRSLASRGARWVGGRLSPMAQRECSIWAVLMVILQQPFAAIIPNSVPKFWIFQKLLRRPRHCWRQRDSVIA